MDTDNKKINIRETVDEIINKGMAQDFLKGNFDKNSELKKMMEDKGIIEFDDEVLEENKLEKINYGDESIHVLENKKTFSQTIENLENTNDESIEEKKAEEIGQIVDLVIGRLLLHGQLKKIIDQELEQIIDTKMKEFIKIVNDLNLQHEESTQETVEQNPKISPSENARNIYNDLLLNGKKQPFNIMLQAIDEKGKPIKKYAPIGVNLLLNSKVTIKDIFLAVKSS